MKKYLLGLVITVSSGAVALAQALPDRDMQRGDVRVADERLGMLADQLRIEMLLVGRAR